MQRNMIWSHFVEKYISLRNPWELQAPPADQGLWTGRKVATWIKDKTGRRVHPQRGWEYLRRLGGTLRVPRPRHAKADQAEQEAFKKTPRGARAGTASRS